MAVIAYCMSLSPSVQIEKTCVVAFATVNNIRETTGETVKQQMRDYLVEVCVIMLPQCLSCLG